MLALYNAPYRSLQASHRCLSGPCVLTVQQSTQTLFRPCIHPEWIPISGALMLTAVPNGSASAYLSINSNTFSLLSNGMSLTVPPIDVNCTGITYLS